MVVVFAGGVFYGLIMAATMAWLEKKNRLDRLMMLTFRR